MLPFSATLPTKETTLQLKKGLLKPMSHNFGILAGLSSGAVAHVTQNYVKNLGLNNLVVMTFADSGRAYLTKGYY